MSLRSSAVEEYAHEQEGTNDRDLVRFARRLLAELVGTFALVTVAAGGATIAAVSKGEPSLSAQVVAPALLVTAMIYAIGPVSGAHFNPAVSLAFALRGNFPWRRVGGYWAVQLLGAVLAALMLRALFGTTGHLGATLPHHGIGTCLVMETILTFFLVTVILATAANFKIVGHNAALAVGATIALDGLFAAPISGASMNPVRSLGPAIALPDFTDVWIYVVGPMAGSVLAVIVAWLLRGPGSPQADEAAVGEG